MRMCTICCLPADRRAKIDAALIDGRLTYKKISTRFSTKTQPIRPANCCFHRKHLIPADLVRKAPPPSPEVAPRTADTIEESKSKKTLSAGESSGKKKYAWGRHPNTLKALKIAPFVPGVSGNPGGKPKYDVGAQIARAVLDQNREAAYDALTKALLKGNAYVFKELCERGFGKLKDQHDIHHVHEDVKDADLAERIAQLESDLGLEPANGHGSDPALFLPEPEGET